MKTKYTPIIIAIIAIVASIVSCSKNEDPGFISERIVFSASMEYPQTKATLNNDGTKVLWEPGDSINMFYGKASSMFHATATEVSANTTFTGVLNVTENGTDKFIAVYPYRKGNTYDGESVVVVVPDIQIARTGSFDREAFVTIAASTDHRLQFKNLCGGVAFTVMQANVNKVVFRSGDGEYIAGKAKVGFDENNMPVISAIIDGKSSIELLAPEGTVFEMGKWYYIAALPRELTKGFIMEFYGSQKTDWKNEKSVSVRRAVWGKLVDADEDSIVSFEDANFKAYCVENFDKDGDGEISVAEACLADNIDVNTDNIISLNGIQAFKNLESLKAKGSAARYHHTPDGYSVYGDCSHLPTPPAGKSIASGLLTVIDLAGLDKLQILDISYNNITKLTLDGCTSLISIICEISSLSELSLGDQFALTKLDLDYNQLTSLDVSHNTALRSLLCNNNHLTTLDISHNTALTELRCYDNQLIVLDLSNNLNLTDLSCGNNQLSTLDVSNNTALTLLWCDRNQLTNLNVINNVALTQLLCSQNHLTKLDVSQNTALTDLSCDSNPLKTIDVSNNTALRQLSCYDNQLTSLDVSSNTSLAELSCGKNNLTTLDVSHNTALNYLSCANNPLATIDISNNVALSTLSCNDNQLTSLDVINNTALSSLVCYDNQLTSLDVSNNTALTQLLCYNNQLTSLDLSNNSELKTLWCWDNQLSSLDVSNTSLSQLYCYSNPNLTELWLRTDQTIDMFYYDSKVTTIKYK